MLSLPIPVQADHSAIGHAGVWGSIAVAVVGIAVVIYSALGPPNKVRRAAEAEALESKVRAITVRRQRRQALSAGRPVRGVTSEQAADGDADV